MKNKEEQLLNIMNIQKNKNSVDLVSTIISKMKTDIDYLIPKLITLKDKLQHIKGYITIANTNNKIKIAYSKDISKDIIREFHFICENWSKKYKIDLEYNISNDYLYLT